MFCPSCGTELARAMSYCNRCGASLKGLTEERASGQPVRLVGAAWAISVAVVAVTLGGFALIFSIIMVLLTRGINLKEGGMALISFTLLIILAINWLLIRQLARIIGKPQATTGEEERPAKKILGERPAPQIEAPRRPASSVTDHTTRTFEPVRKGMSKNSSELLVSSFESKD